MAMSVVYTNFGGMLVHENRGGTERQYVSDPLGSLVAELNSDQDFTYQAEYWPYGEVQAESGANSSNWNFVGLLGYYRDAVDLLYVRARHYLAQKARWLTTDAFWPTEHAYAYCTENPVVMTDKFGKKPTIIGEVTSKYRNSFMRCWTEITPPPWYQCLIPPIWTIINDGLVPGCVSKCRVFIDHSDTDYWLGTGFACGLLLNPIAIAICLAIWGYYAFGGGGCAKENGDTCFTVEHPCVPGTVNSSFGDITCCPGYG